MVAWRIAFFRRKPEVATYRPRVILGHIKGLYTETAVCDHLVKANYAEAAGGSNLDPNPLELLLATFAACIESASYTFAVHEDPVCTRVRPTLKAR